MNAPGWRPVANHWSVGFITRALVDEHEYVAAILFMLFVLSSAMTVMNMLIGQRFHPSAHSARPGSGILCIQLSISIASLEDDAYVWLSSVIANIDIGFGAHMVCENNCTHRRMLSLVNACRGHKR